MRKVRSFSKDELKDLYACVSSRVVQLDFMFMEDTFHTLPKLTRVSLSKERKRLVDLLDFIDECLIFVLGY